MRDAREEDEECGLRYVKLKVYEMHICEDAQKAISYVRRTGWRVPEKM